MSFFGKNIRKIRIAKKMTQTEFAKLFNLKRTAIGAYEEGRAEAKVDTLIKISEYFRISLDVLLKKEITVNDIFHLTELNNANYASFLSDDDIIKYLSHNEKAKLIEAKELLLSDIIPASSNVAVKMPFDCKTSVASLKTGDIIFLKHHSDEGKLHLAIHNNEVCIIEKSASRYTVYTQNNSFPKDDLTDFKNLYNIAGLFANVK